MRLGVHFPCSMRQEMRFEAMRMPVTPPGIASVAFREPMADERRVLSADAAARSMVCPVEAKSAKRHSAREKGEMWQASAAENGRARMKERKEKRWQKRRERWKDSHASLLSPIHSFNLKW